MLANGQTIDNYARHHDKSGKSIHQRAAYGEQSPELLRKFTELLGAARESAIEEPTRDLVAIRAAQMNGCTFCLDMHVK